MSHHRLVIVGSGPAGLTAAIYAARANLRPVLYEGLAAGGQLMQTTEVENYPGFADAIMGPELMAKFRAQAQRFGASLITEDITEVDFSSSPFKLSAGDNSFTSDAVIVSTGAVAKWLGVPGEKEFMGRGVSACATCDGFFFRDRKLVVVGGGDTAMEEALFLTKFASQVTVVHRRGEFRASKIMASRVLSHPKIKVRWNTKLHRIQGNNGVVSKVVLQSTVTGDLFEHSADGVFVAIGHRPVTELFAGQLDLDPAGYIITTPGTTRTSVPGVFAAGDVADPHYRQAVTAAGTGAMAAIDAERWLEDKAHSPVRRQLEVTAS